MSNLKRNLFDGLSLALKEQLLPWDAYFPRMAQKDVLEGNGNVHAVKSFFVREAPFGGSFALVGGITDALLTLVTLRLDSREFQEEMKRMGYRSEFLRYLYEMKSIKVTVNGMPEGSVFFPNEPVVTVSGPLPLVRLAEGIFTEAMNFSSLSLTKWHRLVRVVRPGHVMEFSRRRAQNQMKTSICALLAGCFASSNAEAGRFFEGMNIQGTMGHEEIQAVGDVYEAFDRWLKIYPEFPIMLVDTTQCLQHDFPACLKAVLKHKDAIKRANPKIWGWRNDSGDLAYITIEQYMMFMKHELSDDPWFRERMKIILTNDLDEHSAQEIIAQITTQAKEAGFNADDILSRIIWAAGTKPGTCSDQPSLGGVMKLMEIDGFDCIKLAMDSKGLPGVKTSIPGHNASAWVFDSDGNMVCSLIYPVNKWKIVDGSFSMSGDLVDQLVAVHPNNPAAAMVVNNYVAQPRQVPLYNGGVLFDAAKPNVCDVTQRIWAEVDGLHWTNTRLSKPHGVKVSLTRDLFERRQDMIKQRVLRSDGLNRGFAGKEA